VPREPLLVFGSPFLIALLLNVTGARVLGGERIPVSVADDQTAQSMYGGGLVRRLLFTFLWAAGLFGSFAAYAAVVRPLISSSGVSDVRNSDLVMLAPKGLAANNLLATRYLSERPWTADADHQITRDDLVVFFDEAEPIDDDERAVRLKPFAMIWLQDTNKTGEQPVTIYCDSAIIQFERPFGNTTKPDPGPIVSGSLEGDVYVKGPDNLSLTGRNFSFSKSLMQIFCDSAVRFTYENHSGQAHRMHVDLIGEKDADEKDELTVTGIKNVQLIQDVLMNLVYEEEAAGGKADPVDVTVRSDGSFNFDVVANKATFQENVSVEAVRRSESSETDRLDDCDLLTLIFAEGEVKSSTSAEPLNVAHAGASAETMATGDASQGTARSMGLGSRLVFQRLSADGKIVTLSSTKNKMTTKMSRLVYDGQSKVAELTRPEPEGVQVLQGMSELHCPLILLAQDERGDLAHIRCRGAGWLRHADPETGSSDLTAVWKKELRKRPDPNDSVLDVIELDGQAIVRQPVEQFSLAADFIRLWVDRQNSGGGASANRSAGASTQGIRPRRLHAENNVDMRNPDLHMSGNILRVWFEDQPSPAAVSRLDRSPRVVQQANNTLLPMATIRDDLGRRPSRRLLRRTSGTKRFILKSAQGGPVIPDNPAPRAAQPGAPASPTPVRNSLFERPMAAEPVRVVAETIHVQVIRGDELRDSQVAQVWTQGNVSVTQPDEAGGPPTKITGDILHIVRRSDADQLMHVKGEPAHINNPEFHIAGNDVHLDQGKNKAWVDGPGLLERSVAQDLDGNKLDQPDTLQVRWDGKMEFDGLTAVFWNNVRTKLAENEVDCNDMHVVMSKAISFTRGSPAGESKLAQRAEIAKIICKNGVELRSRVVEDNKLVEIRQGYVNDFTLDQQTGDTTATGPGHIISWRWGPSGLGGFSQTTTVHANRSKKTKPPGWTASRIEFVGTMQGNQKQSTSTFNDGVQITYGPVSRPGELIDPDQLPADAGWMRSESLDVTQRKLRDSEQTFVELVAHGNAELDGTINRQNSRDTRPQTFTARADEITYDGSTGWYRIWSLGKPQAHIWLQPEPGAEAKKGVSQQIQLNPSTGAIRLDQTTGLDWIQ